MINKKIILIITVLLLAFSIAGCVLYDRNYENIQDYIIPSDSHNYSDGKAVVKNISMLKDVVRYNLYSGNIDIKIIFDTAYDGDPVNDIFSVLTYFRTQSAFGAYCIHNIDYDISAIMSYHEADIHLDYSELTTRPSQVIKLSYAYGLDLYIKSALSSNADQLVILIEHSPYTSDEIVSIVHSVYINNPKCSVEFPSITSYMFSGVDNERLYEINFEYSMSEDQLIRRKALIRNIDTFDKIGSFSKTEIQKVYSAANYLKNNVVLTNDQTLNTLYDALIMKRCDAEGAALAFVQMMHDIGMQCEIVYGQQKWDNRCWNIVEINNERYHIDISSILSDDLEHNFIRNDSAMWSDDYRWDTSAYKECTGTLTYFDLWND